LNVLSKSPNGLFCKQDLVDRVPDNSDKVNQYLIILLQLNPPCIKMIKTAGGGKLFQITKKGREVQVFFNGGYVRQLLGVDKPKFAHIDESKSLENQICDLTMDFD
jgi:hypothetical protein